MTKLGRGGRLVGRSAGEYVRSGWGDSRRRSRLSQRAYRTTLEAVIRRTIEHADKVLADTAGPFSHLKKPAWSAARLRRSGEAADGSVS